MVYYGTEILMTGEENKGHGEIRKDFPGGWKGDSKNCFTSAGRSSEQNEALNYLRTLLQWRKYSKAATQGKLVHFIPENEIYTYFRFTNEECVMVVMNNSPNEMKALKTERFAECMKGYRYAVNVITGQKINYFDTITLSAKNNNDSGIEKIAQMKNTLVFIIGLLLLNACFGQPEVSNQSQSA